MVRGSAGELSLCVLERAVMPKSPTDQQRAGVKWQDVYGTERVGKRQNQIKERLSWDFSASDVEL